MNRLDKENRRARKEYRKTLHDIKSLLYYIRHEPKNNDFKQARLLGELDLSLETEEALAGNGYTVSRVSDTANSTHLGSVNEPTKHVPRLPHQLSV